MRDCLDKPRKKMVPIKILDKIFLRRYLTNTQFYFTNRIHTIPKTTKQQAKPKVYVVPRSQKLLSYIKYSDRNEKFFTKNRLYLPLQLKDNFKIAASRDISQRLYIKDEPDDIKTVIEIHPEFYSAIEGRSLRRTDDIKVYIQNIRNYAMNRQQIGYRRDLVLKMATEVEDEEKDYKAVTYNLGQHLKNFQKFLTEDYKKACAIVEKAERIYQDLQAKISEYVGYVIEITLINNLLFKLDSMRNVLKIYRTYLMFAAPLYWRQEFDEAYKALTLQDGEFITPKEQFVTDSDLVDTLDIEKIIELASVELKTPKPPHLYFTHPNEMMYLFRSMELQSREYLIQLSKTHAPYMLLLKRIRKLNKLTKKELDFFQYYIDSVKIEIERELYNEVYLKEKFMRILNESFFDTVASPDTLKLKICIEYVYEQVFGKCDEGHQNVREPMKILEVKYEEYNLLLDRLDFAIVNRARNDFFEQDLQMMRDAYAAQREIREFQIMTLAINKAFLPPAQFKRPEFKKFMSKKAILAEKLEEKRKLKLSSGERVKRKSFKVTPDEREDLLFFTEWCAGMNPAPFLKEIETYIKPVFRIDTRETGVQSCVP